MAWDLSALRFRAVVVNVLGEVISNTAPLSVAYAPVAYFWAYDCFQSSLEGIALDSTAWIAAISRYT